MLNLSGNDFRRARKCQTFREMTFTERGNAKPFGKRLSPSAEMPNHLGNDFRQARKSSFWSFCRVQKHEKVSFGVSVACRSMKKFHLVFLSCAEARKSFIWCFCRVQKRKKVSFGVSVVCRSAKKFHLVFLTCAEA